MSNELKLRFSEAQGHADDITKSSSDAFDILNGLRDRTDDLVDSFTGRTQAQFMVRLDEWKTSSDHLLAVLDSLGLFLTSAATQFDEADQSMAAQIS